LDEDEGPGDGGAGAGVGGGDGAEFVGAGMSALAEDRFSCDDCAIKESTMQGIRSRLHGVRLELIEARQEIENLRSKPSLGGAAEVTRVLNQVATLQKELATSNAAVSREREQWRNWRSWRDARMRRSSKQRKKPCWLRWSAMKRWRVQAWRREL
jgi:hypothetical protein